MQQTSDAVPDSFCIYTQLTTASARGFIREGTQTSLRALRILKTACRHTKNSFLYVLQSS